MKISDLFSRAQRSEIGKGLTDRARLESTPPSSSTSDQTTISKRALELARFSRLQQDEALSKVERLRESVQNGTYLSGLDRTAVAAKVMKGLFES